MLESIQNQFSSFCPLCLGELRSVHAIPFFLCHHTSNIFHIPSLQHFHTAQICTLALSTTRWEVPTPITAISSQSWREALQEPKRASYTTTGVKRTRNTTPKLF
uniref:Uncharacterized protein n=1 Tax=Micrurus carvalhoi TaxID=3147026 RepID=A0A2H6MUH0_9SAUR